MVAFGLATVMTGFYLLHWSTSTHAPFPLAERVAVTKIENRSSALIQHTAKFCQPNLDVEGYVSKGRLIDLKEKFGKIVQTGRYGNLDGNDKALIDHSFSIGPEGGLYSARILRTLSITDFMAEHVACLKIAISCPIPREITGFDWRTTSAAEANGLPQLSWTELHEQWKNFLVQDTKNAAICMTS